MTHMITEGLRAGDLKDMVLPMLTIDEFQSKIDDNLIIVVGFYCFEEDAAHDLSNFVERSPVNVEDTEVSPAPSKEGYYLCFVEMRRSEQFPDKLLELLSEVSRLTDVSKWQFTSADLKPGQVLPLTKENISKHVNLKPKSDKPREQIQEWFQHSSLQNITWDQNDLLLHRGPITWRLKLKEFTSTAPDMAVCMDTQAQSQALRLERLLEGGYEVLALKDQVLISHPQEDKFVIAHVKGV